MLGTQEILDRIDFGQMLIDMGFEDVNPNKSQYLGYCIFHSDVATRSFSASLDKKLFKCFGCGIRGNAIQLYSRWKNISVEAAKIELAEKESSRSFMTLDRKLEIRELLPLWRKFEILTSYVGKMPLLTETSLKSYMNSRGISDSTLDGFGVRAWKSIELDESDAASYVEVGILSRRNGDCVDRFGEYPILFPYTDGSDTVTFLQGRMCESVKDRSKYLGTRGVVPHPYNRAVLYHERDTIYVAEGVLDTLSMIELGYASTIGIPGTSSFKSSWLDNFMCRRVVLALDNDPSGESGCNHLNDLFSRRGIEVVRFQEHKNFKDVNEFLISMRRT